MNISITNACNRRCAYCFQKEWYLSKKANSTTDESVKEMSIETYTKLCDWAPRIPVFKLLGGEPLLHSQIAEFIEVSKEKNKLLTIISNISAEAEKFDQIVPYLMDANTNIKGFLINTDYPKSQEAIFKRNLEILCKSSVSLSFSTTLLPGSEEVEKARERIKTLAELYRSVRGTIEGFRIRLAPFCPNPIDAKGFSIYDFTDDIINFVNGLHTTGILAYGFDCPVNLCELRSDFVDACRNSGFQMRTEHCSPETGMPFDVLVDNSVIWCSSANFLKLNDWREFESYTTARRELSRQYYEWWRKHGQNKKCKSCEKLNPGLCTGFCIAKANSLKHIPIVQTNQVR